MTDNEVVKALECLAGEEVLCRGCAYKISPYPVCKEMVGKDAIDLINRQKAEIDRLNKEADQQFEKWLILSERTKERYADLYEEAKGVVRAEAVKEFAERLKSTPCRFREEQTITWDKPPITKMVLFIDDNDIDDLVKERTGCNVRKTMKKRLIELLQSAPTDEAGNRNVGAIADYLLANGVIAPPCKVGDVLYYLADFKDELFIDEIRVTEVGTKRIFASVYKDDEDDVQDVYFFSDLGESLFFTREEAERALAGRRIYK